MAKPRFTWKMKQYAFDPCVKGEQALDLNGTEKYVDPNFFCGEIYQKGEATERGSGKMLYEAVMAFPPTGNERKEAYKVLMGLEWKIPDDWWAQRARDHGTLTLDESSEAKVLYDGVMKEDGQQARWEKYKEIKKADWEDMLA